MSGVRCPRQLQAGYSPLRSEVDKHIQVALKDLEKHTQPVFKLWQAMMRDLTWEDQKVKKALWAVIDHMSLADAELKKARAESSGL